MGPHSPEVKYLVRSIIYVGYSWHELLVTVCAKSIDDLEFQFSKSCYGQRSKSIVDYRSCT